MKTRINKICLTFALVLSLIGCASSGTNITGSAGTELGYVITNNPALSPKPN